MQKLVPLETVLKTVYNTSRAASYGMSYEEWLYDTTQKARRDGEFILTTAMKFLAWDAAEGERIGNLPDYSLM